MLETQHNFMLNNPCFLARDGRYLLELNEKGESDVNTKHIEHDGGRLGFAPNEKLDCTVRALAIAADIPYADAHKLLASVGRRDGHRFNFNAFMKTLLKTGVNGYKVRRAGDCGITIGRYMNDHNVGRYILGHRGHVFAVVDGTAYDIGAPKQRAKVNRAYAFEKV